LCFVDKVAYDNTDKHMWAVGRLTTSHDPYSASSRELDLQVFDDLPLDTDAGTRHVLSLTGVQFEGVELSLPSAGVYAMRWLPKALPAPDALSVHSLETQPLQVCVVQLQGPGSPSPDTVGMLWKSITMSSPSMECEVRLQSQLNDAPLQDGRGPEAAVDTLNAPEPASADLLPFADDLVILMSDPSSGASGGNAVRQPTGESLLTQVLGLLQSIARLRLELRQRKRLLFLTHDGEGPRDSVVGNSLHDVVGTHSMSNSSLSVSCGLWGLVRSARIELPGTQLLCVDTDDWGHGSVERTANRVMEELILADGSFEVAYRQGVRFAPSLGLSTIIPTRTLAMVDHDSWLCESKGAVLITGGLGGLGIVTAEALVEAGARCVVLASRSGKVKRSDQGLDVRLGALRASGARVVLERCDTSVEQDVEAMLERVRTQHGPLRVVVHAAGVLSDKILAEQGSESMRQVWAPKADGAWFLHKHTVKQDRVLRAFVLYASVASAFGNMGQANYSAANSYLDELARWRVTQGHPGISVQWPAVMGVGMAAAMNERVLIDESMSVNAEVVKWVVEKAVILGPGSQSPSVWLVLTRDFVKGMAGISSLKFMMSTLKVRV